MNAQKTIWLMLFFAITILHAEEHKAAFLTSKTTLWQGYSQSITISLANKTSKDIATKATIADPSIAKVLQQATILAGYKKGYLRVFALKQGQTKLTLDNGQQLLLTVKKAYSQVVKERLRPTIVNPISGAYVWGTFNVGIEMHSAEQKPQLLLNQNTVFDCQEEKVYNQGPTRRFLCKIDASKIKAGIATLVAIVKTKEYTTTSKPIAIMITHPQEKIAGECEKEISTAAKRFGQGTPLTGFHPKASGQGFILNYSPRPAWGFTHKVKEQGSYQMAVSARGDFAGGAFPTVGIYLNNENVPKTTGRLISRKWHRFFLGKPFVLEPGTHTLTLYFMNDFYVRSKADRNLFLDNYELVRITPKKKIDTSLLSLKSSKMSKMANMPKMDMEMAMESTSLEKDKWEITIVKPLYKKIATGVSTVSLGVRRQGATLQEVPKVTLLINNKAVSQQYSKNPIFYIDRGYLKTGENQIQFTATSKSGAISKTPIQTIVGPGKLAKNRIPRQYHRFTIQDPLWEKSDFTTEKRAQSLVTVLNKKSTLKLSLPQELSGKIDIHLESKSISPKNPPLVQVFLESDKGKQLVGTVAINGGWTLRKVGAIQIHKGEKQLILVCSNLAPKRKVWLASATLAGTKPEDRIPPKVAIIYPPQNNISYQADVVIAKAYDNIQFRYADLLIDGRRQEKHIAPKEGFGNLFFPLPLRHLSPGTHQIAVRVFDTRGNMGETEEVSIKIVSQAPKQGTKYQRAVALLNRFAYGPEPRQLASILTLGEEKWLEKNLTASHQNEVEKTALAGAEFYFPNKGNYGVPQRVLHQLLLTNHPARARFVMWAQNHFTTWIRKAGPVAKWREHKRFWRLGAAPFYQLLKASATSPAMIFYLDQHRSFAGRLNENYARELLELHTLGVKGGYTQLDVTTLARLLTGWTLSQEASKSGRGYPLAKIHRFAPALNNTNAMTILGMHFPQTTPEISYQRIEHMLEILASHPSTAKFICRKLIHHYITVDAPKELVEEFSQVFLQSGGDLKEVLKAIAKHPYFFEKALKRDKITSPLDFAVRFARNLEAVHPWLVGRSLRDSGKGLFDCATPDGYPEEDASYANSNILLQRWRFTQRLGWAIVNNSIPGPWRRQPNSNVQRWRQELIDMVAIRLTGHILSEKSNQAAIKVLEKSRSKRYQQMLEIATFIARLPEINMR